MKTSVPTKYLQFRSRHRCYYFPSWNGANYSTGLELLVFLLKFESPLYINNDNRNVKSRNV